MFTAVACALTEGALKATIVVALHVRIQCRLVAPYFVQRDGVVLVCIDKDGQVNQDFTVVFAEGACVQNVIVRDARVREGCPYTGSGT